MKLFPRTLGFTRHATAVSFDTRHLYFAEKRTKWLAGVQDVNGCKSVPSENVSASGSTSDTGMISGDDALRES